MHHPCNTQPGAPPQPCEWRRTRKRRELPWQLQLRLQPGPCSSLQHPLNPAEPSRGEAPPGSPYCWRQARPRARWPPRPRLKARPGRAAPAAPAAQRLPPRPARRLRLPLPPLPAADEAPADGVTARGRCPVARAERQDGCREPRGSVYLQSARVKNTRRPRASRSSPSPQRGARQRRLLPRCGAAQLRVVTAAVCPLQPLAPARLRFQKARRGGCCAPP